MSTKQAEWDSQKKRFSLSESSGNYTDKDMKNSVQLPSAGNYMVQFGKDPPKTITVLGPTIIRAQSAVKFVRIAVAVAVILGSAASASCKDGHHYQMPPDMAEIGLNDLDPKTRELVERAYCQGMRDMCKGFVENRCNQRFSLTAICLDYTAKHCFTSQRAGNSLNP